MTELQNKGFTPFGFVDDIRGFMANAHVYVVPLRIGGGTRLKIVDALSMGKAIVSTSIGCEGLEVENEKHILIADTPVEYVRQIKRALYDDRLRESLGINGRRLVEEKYSWAIIGKKMNAIYESLTS